MKKPIRIAVTGAGGAIGYALIFRIASGDMLGPQQPVILHLLEIEAGRNSVEAAMMELEDCAFPLLHGFSAFFDPRRGFADVNYAILVGARPRSKGMERRDLLHANGEIFSAQGRALNEVAARDVRVVVVGNPANTNALIAMRNSPDLNPSQFTCMLRLDHNRAIAMLAKHLQCPTGDIRNMTVWGNHSSTQFPDLSHCKVREEPALELVDPDWFENEFIPAVQQRGARVIEARGASSAASAASAAIDHVRTWALGTPENDWTSMGVLSDGGYGVEPGLMFSHPVTMENGDWQIVEGLELDEFARDRLARTNHELCEERDAVAALIP